MSTSEQSQEPRVGSLLADKYRIVRIIGQGGMGSVFEAENTALGKRVALKFLHWSASTDETVLARFHREARVISAVESNYIVQVFDWGQDEHGRPFLVMELLEGTDLEGHIRQCGKLPVEAAVRFGIEALLGLRRVHATGIVHRDLKPENLLLVTGDDDLLHVKIVDFGLSKLMESAEGEEPRFEQSARITQKGAVVGTPLYMSPEQVEAVESLDHRTDIWAMGAILFQALAGAPPFMDRSYARLVLSICQQQPPELSELNPEVPPALAAAVRRALAKDRKDRYQDTEQFIAALSEAVPEAISTVTFRAARSLGTAPTMESALGPTEEPPRAQTTPAPGAISPSPPPSPAARSGSAPPTPPVEAGAGPEGGVLDATLASYTRGAATVWLADTPAFSIWRGEVDSPDRLRIEARDGSVRDLRLEPVGTLKLGRVPRVGDQHNELVYPDVASRLAARLRHDGVRWSLERREECSVPVQVGTQALGRAEEAAVVHGTYVIVGAMRATMVDRRYVSRSVPAGTVDPLSGLLARGGLEQEIATALGQGKDHALILVHLAPDQKKAEHPVSVRVAVALHRKWPSAPVARDGDVVVVILTGEGAALEQHAQTALELAQAEGAQVQACGYWRLEGGAGSAGSEAELALDAIVAASGPMALCDRGGGGPQVADLRGSGHGARLKAPEEVLERAAQPKNQMLLFAVEEQAALSRIGPTVVTALEQELAAVISTQVGPSALVTKLASGVVAACVPRKVDAAELGVAVQCEWHARPPVTDGKVELPRTLSWEEAMASSALGRAAELSRECSDAHGVLSALSGGLPYPVAGRVHAAIAASSAIERLKMLFDVLEGTWRLIAVVLAAAYFAKARGAPAEHEPIRAFYERVKTRDGLPLGSWRELARLAAKGFEGSDDPIGALARDLLGVKLTPNQTFDTLSNLMHSERNAFAHGHYNEARAAGDVHEFEQMTRTILRALRPLAAWTLVTVQRTEPDLYGELQTVEFIDHTGPHAAGSRRRIGFNSPLRLANVVYLARWREGLVLPLEPFMRHIATKDRYDLYWMDHLPRAGECSLSQVVSGRAVTTACDARRLPPLLRALAG